MSNPVRQHYIPRSYLNLFAEKREDSYFVDTLIRSEKNSIVTTTTSNVCVQKNIGTFPGQGGDKFAIEKFYASEVDAVYPGVYRMLVNPNITVIGEEDKRKILNTILSLFFRTPQFLNFRNDRTDYVFNQIAAQTSDPEQDITIGLRNGESITFKRKDLEDVRRRRKDKDKEIFLISHFADWQAFVDYKMTCGMEVFTVSDELPIITSDNPPIIMDMQGQINLNHIFHRDNLIEIPIDRRTYFIVYPNSVEDTRQFRIFRSTRDKHFTAGVNLSTEKNSYQQLVSYPGDLKTHFESQATLGAWTADNIQAFDQMLQKTDLIVELTALIKKNKTAICPEVAQKVREIRRTHLLDREKNFESLIEALAKNGYLTM
jgi:hypothetical protein